jgi:hypothetical protein
MSSTTTEAWKARTPAMGALLALDVCGFSGDPALDQLLRHRLALFDAVKKTPTSVPNLIEDGAVKVQFLGDELRFAFHASIDAYPRVVRDFVDNIFISLEKSPSGTRLRGVVREGKLTLDEFHECPFFKGPIAADCATWLRGAGENEVLIDREFLNALASNSMRTDLAWREWSAASPLEKIRAYVLYPR